MYKLYIHEAGFEDEENELFETEEDARDYMCEIESNCRAGAETLNMSNPGDYPYDEDDDFSIDYDIVEVDN